ncbi:hypothetical protein P148_SR1C00001G0473 [candidate division SR1 bacterium RAAC1_SR1_1]|nr:hypothetical protein P148_SR1C00001G0473 [candidate division SR1 bacterium RAAC1_SR1_1]
MNEKIRLIPELSIEIPLGMSDEEAIGRTVCSPGGLVRFYDPF